MSNRALALAALAALVAQAACAQLARLGEYGAPGPGASGGDGGTTAAGGTAGTGGTTGDGGSDGDGGDGGFGGAGGGASRAEAFMNAVLADGPLAYYRLDDPAGADQAFDSSTNRLHADLQPELEGAYPGILEGGLSVFIPSNINLPLVHVVLPNQLDDLGVGGSPFSLEAWIDAPAVGSSTLGIFDDDQSIGGVRVLLTSTGRLRLSFRSDTDPMNPSNYTGDATLTFGPHYVAVTFDGQSVSLYVDDDAPTQLQVTNVAGTNNAEPILGSIGNSNSASSPLGGRLDDVAIYGEALSPTQVSAHYEAGKPD